MKWYLPVAYTLVVIALLLKGLDVFNTYLNDLESQITINRTMTIILKRQVQTLADAGLIGMTSPVAHRLLQEVKVDSVYYMNAGKKGLSISYE